LRNVGELTYTPRAIRIVGGIPHELPISLVVTRTLRSRVPTSVVDHRVGRGTDQFAPLPPLAWSGSGTGGNVNLSWIEPLYAPVTSYRLEVGTGPGLSNIVVLSVSGTSFSFAGAPPGRYHARVRAINSAGVSLPSNEFVLTVPCS
jgi:hypothetical protein